MKLHSLEIQAFGPFSGKETINFLALGENPLFLIDGPTGAGKTSILHAVCYALYGETTDSDRKELGLRCDHADVELMTELSLEFSIRGDTYRITRVPTQMRPAKRGGGETEQKATAHLRRVVDNGDEETLVAKKKTDADPKIVEIIGLTPQQFLQVMVLPQGKFRELLLAKSDDRQVILSTLFQTEIYKRIEQLLKDKAGAIEKQNQSFEDRKAEAYSDVTVADSEGLETSIEAAVGLLAIKLKEKEVAAEKKQKAVTALETTTELNKSFNRQNTNKKDLDTYLQKIDEINSNKTSIKRADKAAAIAPKWQILQGILKDIKYKQAAIANADTDKKNVVLSVGKAREAVAQTAEEYKQRDDLKAEETTVEGYKAKLVSYQTLNDTLLAAENSYKEAIDQKVELEKQSLDITQVLESLNAEIENLNKATENKSEIVEQRSTAKGLLDKRNALEAARSDLQIFNRDYNKKKEQFELADQDYKNAEKEANRTEMFWFSNQAAVLAEKLEEDNPCAVCGSLEHPNPAHFSEDAIVINQEKVNQAKELQAKHFKVMDDNKGILQGYLHSVTDKEKVVKQLETELAEEAIKSVAEVKQCYTNLEQELKAIESKEKRLVKAKAEKLEKESEREPIDHEIKAIEIKIPELTAFNATAKSELDSANKQLPEPYRSTESIELVLTQISQKITALENKQSAANKALTDSLTDESSAQSTLKELNIYLDDLKQRQESQSQLWEQALINSEFITQEDFSMAQLADEEIEELSYKVKSYDDTVKALQTELGLLDEQLKDKQKPDLEKLQQESSALSKSFALVEERWTAANQTVTRLSDTRKKVEQIESQQTEIKKQYEVVGTLSKAASGRGNVRVSLERFVLGNILDQVLSIASERLHIMSKGQYRLIRQNEEAQKRNTTAGLDLAIDDAHTGKIRPVATLSGGESFMASLALALGLSDVVQERSGGVQLDTLFIDEGFGSLDQDSLQLAINTLIDLQSTGRTIGIISHVSELKEQMAQRIEVMGSITGSKIKMVA